MSDEKDGTPGEPQEPSDAAQSPTDDAQDDEDSYSPIEIISEPTEGESARPAPFEALPMVSEAGWSVSSQPISLIEPMDGAVIRLAGHTDARGTESYNSTLSTARAEAVREALIRGGMPAERVIVTGAGEAAATAVEQDVDGMALERRVELDIMDVGDSSRVAEAATN